MTFLAFIKAKASMWACQTGKQVRSDPEDCEGSVIMRIREVFQFVYLFQCVLYNRTLQYLWVTRLDSAQKWVRWGSMDLFSCFSCGELSADLKDRKAHFMVLHSILPSLQFSATGILMSRATLLAGAVEGLTSEVQRKESFVL